MGTAEPAGEAAGATVHPEAVATTEVTAERAARIALRLEDLGISDREFAERTGTDRKALRRAANGAPVRPSTLVAVEAWLDRFEEDLTPDQRTRVPRAQHAEVARVGAEVRQRRTLAGVTIADLAKEARISRDTLADFEAGRKRPHARTVASVLAALDRIGPADGLAGKIEDGVVEFRVEGPNVKVTLTGPVSHIRALTDVALGFVAAVRPDPADGSPTDSGTG